MPRGSSVGDREEVVGRLQMIEKCKSVLGAGGTVYLGEDHTDKEGGEICREVLKSGRVQFFCIEIDTALQDLFDTGRIPPKQIDNVEKNVGHNPPVKFSELFRACVDNGGEIKFVDDTSKKHQERQDHIREEIRKYRRQVTLPGRGVLVLVGSLHLTDATRKKHTATGSKPVSRWQALHEIVYGGLSFAYGRYKTCYMVWQLS